MNKHNGNDLYIEIIAQAIEEMKEVQGESFSLENVNLAELERRTGITRARLRRMKANGFKSVMFQNNLPAKKLSFTNRISLSTLPFVNGCLGLQSLVLNPTVFIKDS